MRTIDAKDVTMLAPTEAASIIEAGGFERPVPFFQSGLIHAWFCRRKDS
jgi:tRNA (cmo5U34)-methyltransferase